MTSLRVLLIEDSENDAELLLLELRRVGYDVEYERVESEKELCDALTGSWDIILSDYWMPRFSLPRVLAIVAESGLDIPLIAVSGTVGEEIAVESLRGGARDFLVKGRLARLGPAIARELREKESRKAREKAELALLETEDQLRQAQKMEAIGRLAGGVAHDFNNLLSVILGYSSIILSELDRDDPHRSPVEEIQKAGVRASDLTRQLLAFSRRQILQPRAIDLRESIGRIENLLRRVLGEDINLAVVVDRVGLVHADPGQIEQVLMNLAVNARDAMPNGGKLTLETRNVSLDAGYAAQHHAVTQGSYVMVAMSDTGVGMDAETQARVFEPFFTTKKGGTGLGLATVFGIVKQSGGHIWVYSEPGRGTTFKIYLPRNDEPTDVAEPTMPPTNVRGSETILVVEDEDQVRDVVRQVLERNGYEVLEAKDGEEALRLLDQRTQPIDLLLTDVIMPGMTGKQLAERLPSVRVLFMSGYTDDSIVHHGVLDAGVSFLQKPLTPDTLLTKVREVLDESRNELTP